MRVSRICRKLSSQIFDTPGACKFLVSSPTPDSLPRESKAEVKLLNWGVCVRLIIYRRESKSKVESLGRANVGKSSLLNSVMGRTNLVITSSKPVTLNFFRVGPNVHELTLVDAPGYGQRGRPEWGKVFDLRRIFLLINAKHGFSEFDEMMLQDIDRRFKQAAGLSSSYQLVLTKIDEVKPQEIPQVRSKVEHEARKITGFGSDILLTSTKGNGFGVNNLRHAIIEACG
ncbi:dynamin family domain-containing protein [Rhizoctonia solani AG-1 IA]|uniref:Dynamin family domain-containing protein n=1 Tax=Thanatephorus cucumeris (strain AG1-IA) TaxID=983506 RepID=L8X331_THACA|nr:dynamin family domain-containing protein [Rhizoctonia solani AG-1 IA]